MSYQVDEEVLEEVEIKETVESGKGLVVYNDDVNSFDHVIETLIKVCRHEPHQAEQCTFLIHFKGKCEVKKGTMEILKPMKDGIIDAGINAVIN